MKFLFIAIIFLLCLGKNHAQTATDFTALDCNGVSYNLFDELDEGKIVVITWTMPCGACVAGALTAYNIVQSFEAQYPGKVVMFLADDFGNTPCSSINAWGNANGITRAVKFSDSVIRMNDYGVAGMPKTVAIAPDHSVIFNENNGVTPDSLQAAIEAALSTTAVLQADQTVTSFSIFPNPASDKATIALTLSKSNEVHISILDLLGHELQKAFHGSCHGGENIIPVDLFGLSNGLYQIRISDGKNIRYASLLISR